MLTTILLLALSGGEPAELVSRLGSDSIESRGDATEQLEAMGAAAFPALEAALSHGDAEVRARAAAILIKSLDKVPPAMIARSPVLRLADVERRTLAVIPKLREWTRFTSREELLSVDAYRELGAIGPDAINILLREMRPEKPLQTISALALFDDPRSAAQLDLFAASKRKIEVHGR